MDKTLVLLSVLLLTTLVLFIMGIFPYPFGVIVFSILLLGRIFILSGKHKK